MWKDCYVILYSTCSNWVNIIFRKGVCEIEELIASKKKVKLSLFLTN
jgi:hypothetical protein